MRVSPPMQPGRFFSAVLNKAVETALPPLYPDNMITKVGASIFRAAFATICSISLGGKRWR